MAITEAALALYVNKAEDLAEQIKKDIQKKGYISNRTVLALNAFTIASNNVKDLQILVQTINKDIQ